MAAGYIRIVCESQDICGESPIWSPSDRSIYWIDINGRKIQRIGLNGQAHQVWNTPRFPNAMALRQSGKGAIVSFDDGIRLFDFDGAEMPFAHPEADVDGNRYNEGKCDPQGRFWTGSMQSNLDDEGGNRDMDRFSGGLYRIDADGSAHDMLPRTLGIANTMAWDVKRERFYFGDSLAHTIYCFDFDGETGRISNQRVFAKTEEHGVPDGSCLDEDGYLWNTRYGGGVIIRYAPDGNIDRIVELPAANPTSCCFGGDDLRTLFVTSACNGIGEAERAANPAHGSLMAFEPGVRGVAESFFAG